MLTRNIASNKLLGFFVGPSQNLTTAPLCNADDGVVIFRRTSTNANKLYMTNGQGLAPDLAAPWLLTTFADRDQGGGSVPDYVQAGIVLPSGTLITANADAVSSLQTSNGTMHRSTDWLTAGSGAANFAQVTDGGTEGAFEFVKGCANTWCLDGNADYAVAGTYGYKDGTGATDRSVWISTDDGVSWDRCFHVESGDGQAPNTHIHMSRIDPYGGCWISLGDSGNYTGLYHYAGTPTTVPDGSTSAGSFVKIYDTGAGGRRPIVAIFHTGTGGEKYIFLGEDAAAACITRLRYDAITYTTDYASDHFKCTSAGHGMSDGDILRVFNSGGAAPTGLTAITTNYYVVNSTANTFELEASVGGGHIDLVDDGSGTQTVNYVGHNVLTAGGPQTIVGACKITDSMWAVATGNGATEYLYITLDYGNSWFVDNVFTPSSAITELVKEAHCTGMMYLWDYNNNGFRYRPGYKIL